MARWHLLWRGGLLACLLALILVPTTSAGGWAVVVLDTVPQGVQPGQTLTLGFTVLQHGVTPTNTFYGTTINPILTLRNQDSGAVVQATGRQEGATGHFVVEFTVPAAGAWDWQIAPDPFPATTLGTLTVAAAPTALTLAATWLPPLALVLLLVGSGWLLSRKLRGTWGWWGNRPRPAA